MAALFSFKYSFPSKNKPPGLCHGVFFTVNCKSKSGLEVLKTSLPGPRGSLALWAAARPRCLSPSPQRQAWIGAGGIYSLRQRPEEKDSMLGDRKSELKMQPDEAATSLQSSGRAEPLGELQSACTGACSLRRLPPDNVARRGC